MCKNHILIAYKINNKIELKEKFWLSYLATEKDFGN